MYNNVLLTCAFDLLPVMVMVTVFTTVFTIDSRSTAALTRMNWLLKMNE